MVHKLFIFEQVIGVMGMPFERNINDNLTDMDSGHLSKNSTQPLCWSIQAYQRGVLPVEVFSVVVEPALVSRTTTWRKPPCSNNWNTEKKYWVTLAAQCRAFHCS